MSGGAAAAVAGFCEATAGTELKRLWPTPARKTQNVLKTKIDQWSGGTETKMVNGAEVVRQKTDQFRAAGLRQKIDHWGSGTE